jgi:hypothetical protein
LFELTLRKALLSYSHTEKKGEGRGEGDRETTQQTRQGQGRGTHGRTPHHTTRRDADMTDGVERSGEVGDMKTERGRGE